MIVAWKPGMGMIVAWKLSCNLFCVLNMLTVSIAAWTERDPGSQEARIP